MSWPWTVFSTLVAFWLVSQMCWGRRAIPPGEVLWRFIYLGWLLSHLLGLPDVVAILMAYAGLAGAGLLLVWRPLVRAWRFLADALTGDLVPACAVIDCWDEGVWTERDGTPHCSAHVGRPTP